MVNGTLFSDGRLSLGGIWGLCHGTATCLNLSCILRRSSRIFVLEASILLARACIGGVEFRRGQSFFILYRVVPRANRWFSIRANCSSISDGSTVWSKPLLVPLPMLIVEEPEIDAVLDVDAKLMMLSVCMSSPAAVEDPDAEAIPQAVCSVVKKGY